MLDRAPAKIRRAGNRTARNATCYNEDRPMNSGKYPVHENASANTSGGVVKSRRGSLMGPEKEVAIRGQRRPRRSSPMPIVPFGKSGSIGKRLPNPPLSLQSSSGVLHYGESEEKYDKRRIINPSREIERESAGKKNNGKEASQIDRSGDGTAD
jgi:hypothetical protein